MEKSLCGKNSVAGGTHDPDHVIVASDMLPTKETANLFSDMPIGPTFGDGPVNDITAAVCNMSETGAITVMGCLIKSLLILVID